VRAFQHEPRTFLMAPGHRLRNAALSLDAVCLSPPRSYEASIGALHNMRSSAASHMRAPGGGAALDLGEVAQGVFEAAKRIKEEPVAEYDGSYECLICSESVRGTAALKCTQCQSNPVCMAQVVVHAYTIHVWHRCWYTHTHMCLCVLCL